MALQEFEAELIIDEDSGGAGIIVPPAIVAELGGKGRIKVRCTIDGQPYRGSIHPYGGVHYLGVLKSIRESIGKRPGDKVQIIMEVDTQPRTVEIPGDLQAALDKEEAAKALFDKLSYSHKKEYVDWVRGANKAETREKRIAKTLEMLLTGKT